MSGIRKLVGGAVLNNAEKDYRKAKKIVKYMLGIPAERVEYYISDRQKLIYLVNSKVACTSIKKVMLDNDGISFAGAGDYDVHTLARTSSRISFELGSKPEGYKLFTMVRNPFTRVLSAYINKFRDFEKIEKMGFEYEDYLGGVFTLEDSFETFVDKVCEIPDKYADRHFVSQYYWIFERSALEMDFVGKLELEDDVARLVEMTGFSALPRMNSTRSYELNDYYQPAVIDKIIKRFKKDFAEFSYDYPG